MKKDIKKEKLEMKVKRMLSIVLTSAVCAAAVTGCGGGKTSDTGSNGSFDTSESISVVSREDGSGTRGAFIELFGIEEKNSDGTKTDKTTSEAIIANKTDVMLTNISGEEYSIGYVSLGSLSDKVKAVKIDGAEATTDNVKSGTYKVSRPFNIATKGEVSPQAQDFINYILSSDGQKVVSGSYIPVSDNAEAYQTSSPSGKIVVAGSSSVSPVMEKLKEAYLALNPDVQIEIQTNDSTSGLIATADGVCDIGMASRELKDSEKDSGLTATPIALDGIAVIVNNDNPIDNLTSEQVKDIFTGAKTSWSEIQ